MNGRGERGPTGDHGQDGRDGPRGPAGEQGQAGADSPELQLTQVLGQVVRSIDRLNFRSHLQTISTILSLIMVVVLLVVVVQVSSQGDRLIGIAETNRSNGIAAANNTRILTEQGDRTNRILSAVESVTSDGARATSRENTQALFVDLQCDNRRAIAGLPAIAPGTCKANTPAEVYPGITGQPLRPLGG